MPLPPSGERLAVGNASGGVRVLQASDLQDVFQSTFKPFQTPIRFSTFSPCGQWLAGLMIMPRCYPLAAADGRGVVCMERSHAMTSPYKTKAEAILGNKMAGEGGGGYYKVSLCIVDLALVSSIITSIAAATARGELIENLEGEEVRPRDWKAKIPCVF